MTKPAIRVENLSKQYQVGLAEPGSVTLRDAVNSFVRSPWKRFKQLAGRVDEKQRFWALKDVSFDVQPGECVGIIGANGAGKSTLLKILSRIAEPTEGRARLRGRVGSLLEVGTGFHEELTGRENVYLNGAILGMRREEITRRFDEIVDFSGVEKFLDTPIKRYSTGMKVRLAFAVAAHLEPEILIVDEVLAVGDAAFQRKCLSKMHSVSKQGRAVLFVTHNLGAVQRLCGRGVVLEHGLVVRDSAAKEAVAHYIESRLPPCSSSWRLDDHSSGLRLRPTQECFSCNVGDELSLSFYIESSTPLQNASASITLFDSQLNRLLDCSSRRQQSWGRGTSLRWKVDCHLGSIPLTPGSYLATVYVGTQEENLGVFSYVIRVTVADGVVGCPPMTLPPAWPSLYWIPEWQHTPLEVREPPSPGHHPDSR